VTVALPPRLRHRMADTILAALHDGRARRQLISLGSDESIARGWCDPDEAAYGDVVRERAQRAAAALTEVALRASPNLDEALDVAALLFDAGLFFEVHEVLEPHWRRATGNTREALQGLIQVAVGYQHWVHGNVRGARALLEDGSARVRGRRVRSVILDGFGVAVGRSSQRVEVAPPAAPPFPRRSERKGGLGPAHAAAGRGLRSKRRGGAG
jgi:hypothetical protein